jgi:hypothetical protein
MQDKKVAQFMALAGQSIPASFNSEDAAKRRLGAQLLLSEVLEYIIKGLGVIPEVQGTPITNPDGLSYSNAKEPNQIEMLDGLSDVAYTMYWNALAFGLPLEQAFDLVCDNNIEKFVALGAWANGLKELPTDRWHCDLKVTWPPEVVKVEVIEYQGQPYAVGKDARGKVRKPAHFKPVSFEGLLSSPFQGSPEAR